MRVVMLVANPIAFDGRVIRHAETLVTAGHEVTVLGVIGPTDQVAGFDRDVSFSFWRLDRRRRGLLPRLLWMTTALRQRSALKLGQYLPESMVERIAGVAELAVATSALELCAKAAALPADVYHGNDLNTLPAVAWAGRLRGRPYLYDAHEFYIDEIADLTAAERRLRRITEGRLARGAAAVLTVNELIADELVRLYGIERPLVLRNLPPRMATGEPREAGAPGTLRLLYHGANIGLSQQGTDDILRAMARVKDRLAVHLTMRGRISDGDRRLFLARAAELHLSDRVTVCPPVSGAVALVSAAVADGAEVGLAVHPPLSKSYRYTTSSKVYEYQAAGLAVCASDLVGNHLTVDERAGVFYPAGDDARLAEIFLQLATDRARLLALRQAAWRRAQEELCWEEERGRLLALYDRLASR